MPFLSGDVRAVQEEILSRDIFKGTLLQLQFKYTRRMSHGQQEDSVLIASDHSHGSFDGIENNRSDHKGKEGGFLDHRENGVETDEHVEENEGMMGEPKYVEHWASNELDGGRVHQNHDKADDVSCDASDRRKGQREDSLLGSILQDVHLEGRSRLFNRTEVDEMANAMQESPESDGPCDVAVKDDVLIDR